MTLTSLRTRALTLVAIAAVSAFTLTACTPEPTPTPAPTESSATPSPTPVTETAPETETEAIDSAERAIANFNVTRGEVNAAGGTDTAPLVEVATGAALGIVMDSAARVVELGWKTEGAITFTPTTGYATDLTGSDGTVYPFSSVTVIGCQDSSAYKVFNSDGTPAQQPLGKFDVLEINVIFEPTEKTWLVNSIIATGETC